MNTYEKSAAQYANARVIPGHSLTRSKAPGRLFQIGAGPLYARHGAGAILTDVDGNDYIDMLCGLGAISLGYGYDQASHRVYSLPHAVEAQAAETVLRVVAPWATQCRFVKTGSEATHAALMIAEHATGRSGYARLRGSYHGWHREWRENAPGVCWLKVGERFHNENLAAVFVEPPRWERFTAGDLALLAGDARASGALVVFDEMIYGGRWARGGATEYFGVAPDLACFGKAIGNGASIACVVGREALRDHGELISGTYSGEVGALLTVRRTLETYEIEPVIEQLWRTGRHLMVGLNAAADAHQREGLTLAREGQPVHQRLRFNDPARAHSFAARMASRGVLWHPEVTNVCYAHTAAHIQRVIEAAEESLREMEQQQ